MILECQMDDQTLLQFSPGSTVIKGNLRVHWRELYSVLNRQTKKPILDRIGGKRSQIYTNYAKHSIHTLEFAMACCLLAKIEIRHNKLCPV